jgi:hypothetical protein
MILLITGMMVVTQIYGQTGRRDLDSVAVVVPHINKKSYKFLARAANISELIDWGGNLYQFFDMGVKEIQYGDLERKFTQNKADPAVRNLADGTMTLVTGIGFNSTTDGKWEIAGRIICNDSLPDWNILMYCGGSVETDRDRVRNEDGSMSVVTSYSNVYYWDKESTGILIESNDTIGSFRIIMNPREDSLLKSLSADIFPHRQANHNTKLKFSSDFSWKTANDIDFGITGRFREKNFSIVSNGIDHKTWIFWDNVFMSMFQEYYTISKKDQITPYLLVNHNISGHDRRDQIRIVIMGRCLNAVLNQP